MGSEFVNIFIDYLEVVATNNYNTIADFHTTIHSTLSLLSLLSLVFNLVTAHINGYSSAVFLLDVSW
jgi:hypothetical protein